jgi:hypothetical protein
MKKKGVDEECGTLLIDLNPAPPRLCSIAVADAAHAHYLSEAAKSPQEHSHYAEALL